MGVESITDKMAGVVFRDRDMVQDDRGDLYQILGSIHPPDAVFALETYHRIPPSEIQTGPASPFYWIQNATGDHFIRQIRKYTAQSAAAAIAQHPYHTFSPLFHTEMLLLPTARIVRHWNPQHRFQTLLDTITHGSFSHRQALDPLEREAVEVAVTILEECRLSPTALGITGSLLWGVLIPDRILILWCMVGIPPLMCWLG